MRILVLCDQGQKRSKVLAHQLTYLGHDVLTAGIQTNSEDTLRMLVGDWAEKVILTDRNQSNVLLKKIEIDLGNTEIWHIGPDNYPEQFNPALFKRIQQLIRDHPEVRKP